MNDHEIIELYWKRDEKAIGETSGRYGKYCYAIADNILHNEEDAEECVNDTWMKTWNTIPPQRPERFKIFLAKITRNLSFNKYKHKKAEKRGGGEIMIVLDELSDCIADQSDVESTHGARELNRTINAFALSLNERDCNIFVRRYFFTESITAISKRYGLSENHIMVILSRTRKKLKNHLQQEGYLI